MNEFRTAYRKAVADMKTVHIDVASVLDEGRRKQVKRRRIRQKTATCFAALLVLTLGTLGTVQAADYVKTVIKVNENGFTSADLFTASLNENLEAGGGVFSATPDLGEEEERQLREMPEDEVVIEEYGDAETGGSDTTVEYDSIEAFQAAEDTVFAFPDMALLGETTQQVWVSGMFITARIECGDKYMFLDRMDYSDSEGHASSTAYAGGVCNERTYKTAQGYEYILIDSVRESEEEPVNIHAAVTVGNYEMYMDFSGYEQSEVEEILESMDLSVYEP